MGEQAQIANLHQLLDRLEEAGDGDGDITVDDIRHTLGRRSFGPFLLIVGLIGSTPASGIPGLPTVIGITVLLTAGQLVLGLKQIWLPGFLLRRSMSRERLGRAIRFLRWPAGLIDRVVRPRLAFLTRGPVSRLLGACCCIIAVVKPPLEFIPATSAVPAAVVAIFGLALTTQDGAVAIVALIAFAALATGIVFLGGSLVF